MNEDFNTDERTEIDDLFRDVLSGYSEAPSGGLWKKLNRKLNRREAVYFIAFRKTPGIASSEKHILPLYRQQWVRVAVAASIAILLVFISGIILKQTSEKISPKTQFAVTSDGSSPIIQNNNDNYSFENIARNFLYADAGDPGNNNTTYPDGGSREQFVQIPLMPYRAVSVPPETNDLYYADNNPVTNPDPKKAPDNYKPDNIVHKQNTPENSMTGEQGPVLADAGFNPQDPIAAFNIRSHNDTDAARLYAARVVDSLISANVIRDPIAMEVKEVKKENRNESVGPDVINSDNNSQPQKVDAPNVFTPNGDGINDFLYFKNLDSYAGNSLMVFDRNGQTVFQQNEYGNDWDAAAVDDGTYFYILTYKDSGNNTITLKGMVYIKRTR